MSQSGNISQDMFDDSMTSQASMEDIPWRGVPLSDLNAINQQNSSYPQVRPSSSHSVLFQLPLRRGEIPKPYPDKKIDRWDESHVRMPNSPQSLYPVSDSELKSRWAVIREALERPISTSEDLEGAIFSYNSKNNKKFSFFTLHDFFSQTLDQSETEYFFKKILPGIIQLALKLPEKVRGGIPLLRKHLNKSVTFTQDQIACLMANAFLCTFPRRNSTTNYNPYPRINFNGLFQLKDVKVAPEKLKCFINYFRRVLSKTAEGVVTFSRHHVDLLRLPNWAECEEFLPDLHITSVGTIEDEGGGMMEIDFANKLVGGGVLGRGAVQEEIKFLICPELLISRLLTECLDISEALIVTGCERFNKHTGYGDTFTWAGDYIDSGKRDEFGRRCSTVVAIDATHYRDVKYQFTTAAMKRELNKAFVGFSFGSKEGWKINIATGNWGCGAFRGDARLKTLLQLMAAAVAKRNVAYFTFQDEQLRDSIYEMYRFLRENKVTVGNLWKVLTQFNECNDQNKISLYDFIYNIIKKEELNSSVADRLPEQNCTSLPHKYSPMEENDLTEEEMAEALRCVAEIEASTPTSSKEPISAETYSIKTEAGRKRCIEIERERWKAYQIAKKELTPVESGIPSNSNFNNNLGNSKSSAEKSAVKRKISDYFMKK